ncbi:hypothetical protein [Actinosynnema sp. NPDC020468]|uniref:hypothetical protein n=1 Tax=Actinosynnema sp. NPDC020468 TaxID=3154488 RepID=UPI0033C72D28
MRFVIRSDRQVVVAFEPTAAEYVLEPGATVAVEWFGEREDGMVSLEAGKFVIAAPTAGYIRAWDRDGVEIYIGPESGPDAQ